MHAPRPVLAVLAAFGLAIATALVAAPLAGPPAPAPSVEAARAWVEAAEKRLLELGINQQRASWVQSNFITQDTEILAAEAARELLAATAELAGESTRFANLDLPADLRRKIDLIRTSLPLAVPRDTARQRELTEIAAGLESAYGKGTWCPDGAGGDCLDLNRISRLLATGRDPAELLAAWRGWHAIAPPMRAPYRRFVELGNEGARELGFRDLGAMWRSGYDMPPDQFAAELDRLWGQVRPLYEALHCHVRAALAARYSDSVVLPREPIPAHLLGNMWAQSWGNIYDLVAPPGGDPGFDLSALLKARGTDERAMVRFGERFFMSLGFEALPPSFWERSLFTKPADRDVVCHASAWDIDFVDDLRIKMCIEINEEDFSTIHHELGHNYYQRAYNRQSALFRDSANDGFHEGIGDTLALSITPAYLVRTGLLDKAPGPAGDLGLLMKMALEKVAFLPFGLLVDQWRWQVFSGAIGSGDYNKAWWTLRERYQGVAPGVPRTEADFDPGAKYHVPANTPYTRYFLAAILQFQFHRALCEEAGFTGPLHACSIYGNAAAGARLRAMMEMGRSRPWPEALAALTGKDRMDATAILDYFAPLKTWLDQQNAGRECGW